MSNIKKRRGPCYCINLRRATNIVTNRYDELLKPTGLSVNQYSLLSNLNRFETASVSDLAAYVGLDRTTVVRALKPLEAKGLIEDKSTEGERDRKLCVSSTGIEMVKVCGALWKQAQGEIESLIGKDNVDKLAEILSRITDS